MVKSSAQLREQMLADLDAILIDREQRERQRVARLVARRASSATSAGATRSAGAARPQRPTLHRSPSRPRDGRR